MVGGESLGCRTCKQRRIKCDERNPICFQCEKSRRTCPGPQSPFRFYYGNKAQKVRLEGALQSSNQVKRRHSRYNPPELHRDQALPMVWQLIESSRPVPDVPGDRSRRLLVYALTYQGPVTFNLQQLGAYFEELPARMGRDEALDAVVECFITSYTNRLLSQTQSDSHSSLELIVYGTAVKTLRESLEFRSAQQSEETLCAALLLCVYEFFLRKPSVACVSLAGGVTSILRAWGPSRITSTFALTMFEGHFISMISNALFFGTDCFLAAPGWHMVFQACPNLSELARQIWLTVVCIPQFLKDVRDTVDGGELSAQLSKEGSDLRSRILILECQISISLGEECVYHAAPELYEGHLPTSAPHPSDIDSSREIVFRAIWVRAALIMINGSLRRLNHSDKDRLEEEERAARWLAQTMSFAIRLGPVNGSFCTLAGAAAFGASDTQRKEHIAVTLSRWLDDTDSSRPGQRNTKGYYEGLDRMYNALTGGPVVKT